MSTEIPLLRKLNDYGKDGKCRTIKGSDVGEILTGYGSLLDFIPESDSPAIGEPSGDREPLTHKRLRQFVTNEFDLVNFGLPHSSRVSLLLPNGPELAVTVVCLMSRWCAAPINPTNTKDEIKAELVSTKARAIIILAGAAANEAALQAATSLGIGVLVLTPSSSETGLFRVSVLHPVSQTKFERTPTIATTVRGFKSFDHPETVLLLHTSGTSGNKKLVPYSLDMIIIGVGCIVSSWNLGPQDVCLNMMPLFHIGGIMRNVLSPILSGGCVMACNGFDPLLFWDVLCNETSPIPAVTWYYAAPTMHHALLQEAQRRPAPLPISSVRFIANAAGGLLPVLAEALRDTFEATILTSYGMTECMPISSPPQDYRLQPTGTSGIAVGPEVIIVDDSMTTPVSAGVKGNILVRGPPCFGGYENNGNANEESFFSVNGEDGWFNTGDMGSLDEQGYLFISGRSKEIINRGGETISPFEIEEAVIQHDLVKETLAFSSPHKEFQETVGAVIVSYPGKPRIDLSSLHKYLEDKLHRSKWPQLIVFMDALPKNVAGKILRIRLAERMHMADVDEESSPLSRLYEAQCPPVGTTLMTPIALHSVNTDPDEAVALLRKQASVEKATIVRVDLPFRPDALVAFVQLKSGGNDVKLLEELQHLSETSLNRYIVPAFIHRLSAIPVESVGGGFNYDSLKITALQVYTLKNTVAPRNAIETQIEAIWREQLGASSTVSVVVSFFNLGGDSLKAGRLVAEMRKRLRVQLSVADLFSGPTIENMAHKVSAMKTLGTPSMGSQKQSAKKSALTQGRRSILGIPYQQLPTEDDDDPGSRFADADHVSPFSNTSIACLFVQALPLVVLHPVRRLVIWFLLAAVWVELMRRGLGRFEALLFSMFAMRATLAVFAPLAGIMVKWLIIGKYKPGRYPLWGSMYLRWWIVEQAVNVFGKGIFRDDLPIIGPHLVRLYYVMMGARIGHNVKIHRDAKLGQADLLTIGDDVCIDHATVRPFAVEEGHFILLPISIGSRCAIGVKSVVAPGANLKSGTCLGPLSSSYESDDAEAHFRDYCRTAFATPPSGLVIFVGIPILILVAIVSRLPWFIGLKFMIYHAKTDGWFEREIHSIFHAFLWWITPTRLCWYFVLRMIRRCLVPCIRLGLAILIKWTVIGKFKPLNAEEKGFAWNRFRYWLMARLLPGGSLGGVSKLVGTHYSIISAIFRALGAKIGHRIYWPGSGLEIVEYDLLEVGDDVVFGSRSVVLTSSAKRSARVTVEAGAMVADRCVILPGVTLRRGSVLGSGSLAAEDFDVPVGSVWVGSQNGCAVNAAPSDASYGSRDTLTPFGRAFYLHQATYTVIPLWFIVIYNSLWQAFCTCFRHCGTPLALVICKGLMEFDVFEYSSGELLKFSLLAFIPLNFILSVFALSVDVAAKWLLLGKREHGVYSWDHSTYCQNWQAYLTIQEIRRADRRRNGILDMIQGSEYLVWYYRALGSSIGDNVCLYPNGGDPMMTEPDLVTIGDGAVVDDASLIAHINTRGTFRLNPLSVGKGCVLKSMTRLLSGASMEASSILLEHTLVLAGETVDVGNVWQGWPSIRQFKLTDYREDVKRAMNEVTFNRLHHSTASVVVSAPRSVETTLIFGSPKILSSQSSFADSGGSDNTSPLDTSRYGSFQSGSRKRTNSFSA